MDEAKLDKITDIGATIAVWAWSIAAIELIALITWVWCIIW